jgi:hypothetical protein
MALGVTQMCPNDLMWLPHAPWSRIRGQARSSNPVNGRAFLMFVLRCSPSKLPDPHLDGCGLALSLIATFARLVIVYPYGDYLVG